MVPSRKPPLTMSDSGFDITAFLTTHQQRVNECLERIMASFDPKKELVQAMGHSLMAGESGCARYWPWRQPGPAAKTIDWPCPLPVRWR